MDPARRCSRRVESLAPPLRPALGSVEPVPQVDLLNEQTERVIDFPKHHDNQTQNPGHLRGRAIKTQALDDDTADLYVLIARPL